MSRILNVLMLCFFFAFGGCNAFQSENSKESKENSYQSLNEIVPQKYEIEDKIEGNLNLDEFPDELILIRMLKTNERRLIILLGKEDGKYSLLVNSNRIVLKHETGAPIDPYLSVKYSSGAFSILQLDMNMKGCQAEYAFGYVENTKGFILKKIEFTNCENSSDNAIRTARDFGTVNLVDFDISKTY